MRERERESETERRERGGRWREGDGVRERVESERDGGEISNLKYN